MDLGFHDLAAGLLVLSDSVVPQQLRNSRVPLVYVLGSHNHPSPSVPLTLQPLATFRLGREELFLMVSA